MSAPLTLADALAQWSIYRGKLVDLHLVALATYRNQVAITQVVDRAIGEIAVDALRKSHIEIFVGERLQTCAPVTVRGELNVLRQVLNWCVDEQLLASKPRMPTVKVAAVEASLPSDAAFLWVLATAPPAMARALEFMMLTGLSPHELERVQVRDRSAWVAPAHVGIGQRDDFPVKQPSRRRWVPLNDRAAHLWWETSAGMGELYHLFPKVDAMQKALVRMRQRAIDAGEDIPAGAETITPKLMRKWFASHLATGGTPEHVLQKLMGHTPGSPITRAHYVRSSAGQTAEAVERVAV